MIRRGHGRERPARGPDRPALLTASLLLLAGGAGRSATASALPRGQHAASANGPFVLLIPDARAPYGTLVLAQPGQGSRILARGLPPRTTLAPAPNGRSIALGEGLRGLWIVAADGTHPRRVVAPPAPLVVGAVAWSPDRCTLAYILAVDGPDDDARTGDPRRGLWLVGCQGTHPRQLIALRRLGAMMGAPAVVSTVGPNNLSWSRDGRTVLIAAAAGLVAVDVATGRAHVLVRSRLNAGSIAVAAYSPAAPRLFYIADRSYLWTPNETLVVAGVDGRHARPLLHSTDVLTSQVWAPDGRSIAYIWQRHVLPKQPSPPLEVRVVDLATGRVRRVALPPLRYGVLEEQPAIAWLRAQA